MICSSWVYVLVLAVIQGIAEFLPISSSGHLAICGALFGLKEDVSLGYGIVLHAGSLLATCVFYFTTLIGFFRRDQIHLALMVILGSVPAGIAGVTLHALKLDEKLFSAPIGIGIAFLITATVLRLTDKPKLIVHAGEGEATPLKRISIRQALTV